MAQMLAPHLTFPPEGGMYPQTLEQVYGPNVMYAPGMPPQPQFNVAPAYTPMPYGSPNALPYHMQQHPSMQGQPSQSQTQGQFMPPSDMGHPSQYGGGSGNSAPYLPTGQGGRMAGTGLPGAAGGGSGGGNPPADQGNYPAQSRMQSWPGPAAAAAGGGGGGGSTNSSFPPGLPLAPSVNIGGTMSSSSVRHCCVLLLYVVCCMIQGMLSEFN
jgi:hypothetical protein